jgi:hypothetical protein
VAAFQPYAGVYGDGRETVRWSCYATCAVYEVRSFGEAPLPDPPSGRKWVQRPLHERSGPPLALLVDEQADDFSQMLAQIKSLAQHADA